MVSKIGVKNPATTRVMTKAEKFKKEKAEAIRQGKERRKNNSKGKY